MTGARFEVRAGVRVLTFPVFDGHAVDAVVTTAAGGVSTGAYESLNLGFHVGDDPDAVRENRRRAAATIGLGLDDLVFCNQTHGRVVVRVGAADRGRGAADPASAIEGADALVTTDAGVGIAVMVADCVPIVLFHPDGVLACVHAGWRGTVARVLDATLEVFDVLGADRGGVRAAVGPAIPAHRYQVGAEVADAARDAFGGPGLDDVLVSDDALMPDEEGRWRFDLWAANARVLREAGVPDANVEVCTVPTGDGTFFSDRARRPCGRFAALARLT